MQDRAWSGVTSRAGQCGSGQICSASWIWKGVPSGTGTPGVPERGRRSGSHSEKLAEWRHFAQVANWHIGCPIVLMAGNE